ncbi:MAG TPA: hypothetical protein VFU22_33770, partial [Roseiflexaceae bacterium]|nr:hypothetical protein [Roseiflexaceae bacterium]
TPNQPALCASLVSQFGRGGVARVPSGRDGGEGRLHAQSMSKLLYVVPGTEQLQGYRAYWFHFHAFLKGVVGSLIASLVIAALTTMIVRLSRV